MPVHDGQSLEAARRIFDDRLGVSGWGTPTSAPREVDVRDPKVPWWWDEAEADQSTQVFMEMARVKGLVE